MCTVSDWPSAFGSQPEESPLSEDSDEADIRATRRQKRNGIVSASESDSEEEWAEKVFASLGGLYK